MHTVFQKKTSTHIIVYKLRNSCLILIFLTPKFLTQFDIARQLSCPPHLTNVSTLPCKTYHMKHGV